MKNTTNQKKSGRAAQISTAVNHLSINNKWTGAIIVFVLLFFTACNPNSRGFVLPEGDVAEGKATFVSLGCDECHTVGDIKWAGEGDDIKVVLGGDVSKVKSYGELVTSVINPSHKIARRYREDAIDGEGKSKMERYRYNEVMTVNELVDIVSFLQTEYKVVTPSSPYSYQGW